MSSLVTLAINLLLFVSILLLCATLLVLLGWLRSLPGAAYYQKHQQKISQRHTSSAQNQSPAVVASKTEDSQTATLMK
jgi:hypothetical protein